MIQVVNVIKQVNYFDYINLLLTISFVLFKKKDVAMIDVNVKIVNVQQDHVNVVINHGYKDIY